MDRLAAVEESVKEMNSALNGPEDTQLLSHLMSARSSRQPCTMPVAAPPLYPLNTGDSLREFDAVELRLEEENEENLYAECEERKEKGEGDYSEPADTIPAPAYNTVDGREKEEGAKRASDAGSGGSLQIRRQRFSEGNLQFQEFPREQQGKRKLSLGLMIRKISQGKERRLSSVLQRLVSVRPLGSSTGHQTDSSSWEFLSGESASSSPSSTQERREGVRLSSDSVYESEYDSSAMSSLNRQSDSAFSSLTPSTDRERVLA